jgi:hypothetical protein
MKQFITEAKRLQELAGIVTEETQQVNNITLYASYYPEDYDGGAMDDNYKNYTWKPEFKNGITSQINKGATGTTEGKPAILCSKIPFFLPDEEGDDIPQIDVQFQKPLNQVYIDMDDYDLDEFGVEDYDGAEEWISSNPKTSLADLVQFGLDADNEDLSFYGCYVDDIKSNEIIDIKYN